MEKVQQPSSPSKFKNFIVGIHRVIRLNHVFNFLIFVVGISVGIIFSFYVTNLWFSTKTSMPSNYLRPLPLLSPALTLSLTPPPPKVGNPLETAPGPPSFVKDRTKDRTGVLLMKEQPPSAMHNMSDEELLLRASMVGLKENSSNERSVPKVAFMFLSSGHLHMAPMWEKFFKGYNGFYSIYWHPHPAFDGSYIPKTSVFYNRRIPSQPVSWGSSSMMDAERRLLANALLDLSNQRFVLLSESCIPVFNFTVVYTYLINSRLSFLQSFYNSRTDCRARYNPKMSPSINLTDWRKGSQWFELNRDLAINVITDKKIYPIFQQHCHPPCYVDEHYIQTLVNLLYSGMNSNRSVTWVDWSRGGPHPMRYGWDDVTDEFLYKIRFGSNCTYNGKPTNICFLFARKFAPHCLEKIMRIAPLLLDFQP